MDRITKISDLIIDNEYYLCISDKPSKYYKVKLLAIINEFEVTGHTELYVEDKTGTNLYYFCEIGIGNTRPEAKKNYGRFNYEKNEKFVKSYKYGINSVLPGYEIHHGVPTLILARKTGYKETDKCPFCKKTHIHGTAEGHRVAHCSSESVAMCIAADGVVLKKSNGYIIRHY